MYEEILEMLVKERLFTIRRMIVDFYYITDSFESPEAIKFLDEKAARCSANIASADYARAASRVVSEEMLERIAQLREILEEWKLTID